MSDQIETAAAAMTRDYLILAFLVSLGSLQIAVSISGIRGLWLLPNRILTRTLGIILIIAGITAYILSPMWLDGPWAAGSVEDGTSAGRTWGTAALSEISSARNLNDIHGGMAGTAYAGFFILAAVLATLFAAAIGVVNHRLFPAANLPNPESDGLDALKHSDALATFLSSLRQLIGSGPADIRISIRSTHRWSISSIVERTFRN